jgi:predicted RNA-binding Zn ribbon-like protein
MSIARSVIPNGDWPSYNGRWNDTFLMSAADVLQTAGKMLRVCPAEGCEILFAKRKRRIFCSEKCSGRERMRRFQEDATRYKAKRRKYYLKSKRTRASVQAG